MTHPLLSERNAQEDRLREAGFRPDGGGVGLGGWDLFVYKTDDPDEWATVLTSVEEVDEFIRANGGNDLVGALA